MNDKENWKPYELYTQCLGITKKDLIALLSVDDISKLDNDKIKKLLPVLLFLISDVINKGIVLISSHPKLQPIIVLGLNNTSLEHEDCFTLFGCLYFSALFVKVKSIYEVKRKQKATEYNRKHSISNKTTKSPSISKRFLGKPMTSAQFIINNDILTNRLVDLPHYQLSLMQLLCQCPTVGRILMKTVNFSKKVNGKTVSVTKAEVLVSLLKYSLEQTVQSEIS